MYFYIHRTVKTFTKLQVTNMKLFEEKTFLYTVFSYLDFLSLILLMHREAGEGIGTSLPLSLLKITIWLI